MQVGNWKDRSDLKEGLRPSERQELPACRLDRSPALPAEQDTFGWLEGRLETPVFQRKRLLLGQQVG